MSSKRTKSPDAWAWLTKPQTAAAVGYSVRQFGDVIHKRMPAEATRGKGNAKKYDVRAAVKALAEYVAEQNKPKPEDGDPLWGGDTPSGKDPVLDAYRREQTEKVRLENQATRRELVDRSKVMQAMSAGFAAAGNVAGKLVLRFGNDAGDLWNEGIDAMRDAAMVALKSDDEAPAQATDETKNEPSDPTDEA